MSRFVKAEHFYSNKKSPVLRIELYSVSFAGYTPFKAMRTALLTGPIVQFFMPRTARLLYSILRRLTPQAESA